MNHGWMHAVRMFSPATMGSRERIRPNTPCFATVYCCALNRPTQEAEKRVNPLVYSEWRKRPNP